MSVLTNSILCMIVSGGKTAETLDAIDCNKSKRRSEPTARSRPKSRRLHPLGALMRPHRKGASEDPSRLHAVSPNLGGYTQWVR